jgi:hypothetical protein
MKLPEMKKGQYYRVTFLIPGVHRKPHVFTGQFLFSDHRFCETYFFNMRPLAGTASVEKDWVIGVEPADDEKPILDKVA